MKLSQLTIKRYYELMDVIQEDDLSLDIKKAAFMAKRTYKEATKMPMRKMHELALQFDAIENDLTDIIPNGDINISGRVFKCVYGAEKMQAGQYIDYRSICERYQDNPKNIHALLAVMSYEGEEYDGTKSIEKEQFFLESMTMKDAYPYAFFLSVRLKALNEVMLPYFIQEYPKWRMNQMMTLAKGGGGLSYWNAFVRYIGRTWMRLHALVSLSFLIGGLMLRNVMIGIKRRWLHKKGR